jgi:hypothetical protein
LGTRGSAKVEIKKLLLLQNTGVQVRENLEMRDGFFVNDENIN